MAHEFSGKTVVVTGSGGGLGRSHALAFARHGATVVVNDPGGSVDGSGLDQTRAQTVVEEILDTGGQALADTHSISEKEGAEALIRFAMSETGRIDVLVNNAGILRDRSIRKMEDQEWHDVIAVHLTGTFFCTRLAARAMANAGTPGAIVNTTSTSGLFGNFGQANYGAAKSGIAGLTRVAAIELASKGIRVNAIAPIAKTRMTADLPGVGDNHRPEQVSPLVLFLASERSREVTGRVFTAWNGEVREVFYASSTGAKKSGDGIWTLDEIEASWDTITQSDVQRGLPLPI